MKTEIFLTSGGTLMNLAQVLTVLLGLQHDHFARAITPSNGIASLIYGYRFDGLISVSHFTVSELSLMHFTESNATSTPSTS
jgi:hypothetical protein